MMLPIHYLDRQQFCCQKLGQNTVEYSSVPRGVAGHQTERAFISISKRSESREMATQQPDVHWLSSGSGQTTAREEMPAAELAIA